MTISPNMNAENELLKEKSVLSTHEILSKEVEEGNIEYKYKLCDVSEERLTKLISQMSWRLSEGFGEAIYELGINDNGIPIGLSPEEFKESLENIAKMANTLGADYSVICEREIQPDRKVAEVLIRKFSTETTAQLLDVRIAFLGNIDSGKSTTCGVLSSAGTQLDNGKGRARVNILCHKHEVECGRSSSISHVLIAFDSKGAIVNNYLQSQDNESLVASSTSSSSSPTNSSNNICKMINVIDMCGLEKYFKHTAYGMTKSVVDYAAIFISATVGLTKMTKEHLDLCIALKIPFFFVITKTDVATPSALSTITDNIHKMMKTPGIRKLSYVVKTEDDVITCAKNMSTDRIAPIFPISNVNGTNLNLLQQFMNLLPLRKQWETLHEKPTEIIIDQQFEVQNVGTVVSGIVYQGMVGVGDTLLLGPINEEGKFQSVQIKSIHYRRMGVKRVTSGQFATFALKFGANTTTIPTIRKGMVLLEDAEMTKGVVWNFEAELILLNSSYVLKPNAQFVLHCLGVKQTAKIVQMEPIQETTGSTTNGTNTKFKVQFQFLFRAEYLKEGERILVREGKIKSIGTVTKLL